MLAAVDSGGCVMFLGLSGLYQVLAAVSSLHDHGPLSWVRVLASQFNSGGVVSVGSLPVCWRV